MIEGLNGYFEAQKDSDENVIYVKSHVSFRLDAGRGWVDILIAWLRTTHGIFYYPGMEAKYAKTEKILPFSERIRKETEIEELKEQIVELQEDLKKAKIEKEKVIIEVANRDEELESIQKDHYELYLEYRDYIMRKIRYEASRNGFTLPEKIDGAPLTIERTFHDLLEMLKKREEEIKELKDLLQNTDAVKQYEKELLSFIYKEYERHIHDDRSHITYNPPSVRNTIIKILSDYASSEARVEILENRIKSIFDKYKLKFTVDEHATDNPTTMFMLDSIASFLCNSASPKDYAESKDKIRAEEASNALQEIYTTVAAPIERLRYGSCDEPTIDHMKSYILKRFESFHSNTEYCIKKMTELDARTKDCKILKEQQEFLVKENKELAIKVSTKDAEIKRLKDLINAVNEEVGDM